MIKDIAKQNMAALKDNVYPGRGIVIGQTPDGTHLVQVYWIMGRSENSRNRIFVQEDDTVRTAAFDESKVEDPSLIIYNVARVLDRKFIVTNGDQTDTIYEGLKEGRDFEQSLYTRTFEPDAPNYTPRISGVVSLDDKAHTYQLSVIKSVDNDPAMPVRFVYGYEEPVAGLGHFVATYDGDGNPLPSFSGEPRPVELLDDLEATRDLYWNTLNEDNKVSLMVRFIDAASGASRISIVNKHG